VKNRTDELLDAVLLEAPAMEASLRRARGAARRRRWTRRLRGAALVAVVVAAGLVWLRPMRTVEHKALPPEAPYVVHTRALPEGYVIKTQERSVEVVRTSGTSVQFFTSVNVPAPERIDDEMLLQLAPHAILVQHATGPPQLVFPSAEGDRLESQAGNSSPP